ncbi:hypothetical protein ACQJBY_041541 [Aegilops geniculata]
MCCLTCLVHREGEEDELYLPPVPAGELFAGMLAFALGERANADNRPTSWQAKVAACFCTTITNFVASLLSLYLLWLIIFRPYKFRPNVDAAILAAFDLDAARDTLSYDLSLNVTFFNDHRIYSVRFDHLTAGLYYNGTKLGPSDDATLPSSFTQKPRRHRTVYPVLRGQASNISATVEEEFSREQARGSFTVDVMMRTTLTYKFWPTRAIYYYQYNCWLNFPDPAKANRDTPAVTGGVRCGVK